MKKCGTNLLTVLMAFLIILTGIGSFTSAQAAQKFKKYQELSVHFIDVGQGDCTLITCGEHAMLVDAGDKDQGTKIQNYLQKRKIKTLDYVIMTHPDADHIGGMPVILTKFDCKKVIMPDVDNDTAAYRNVRSDMTYKNYKPVFPKAGKTYKLGDAKFTILSPLKEYNDTNSNSIVFRLKHGKNSFLFTGDATIEAEKDMIASGSTLRAKVLHVGHHGSYTSTSLDLLKKVKPEYALISCGEKNDYGHPHAETLNKLRKAGVKLYRTDEQGSVVVRSNGKKLKWNCSPSSTWKAGERTDSGKEPDHEREIPSPEIPSKGITYVCNTNTMKFHRTECNSVTQMNPKNRKDVKVSREELLREGYTPCKNCNP